MRLHWTTYLRRNVIDETAEPCARCQQPFAGVERLLTPVASCCTNELFNFIDRIPAMPDAELVLCPACADACGVADTPEAVIRAYCRSGHQATLLPSYGATAAVGG